MSDFVEKNLFLTHFLPPRTSNRPFPSVAKPPARPAPRNGQPGLADQRAKDLGGYGFRLVHLIEKDYTRAIGDWRDALGEVIAAFGTAVGERDSTLEQAKAERERDAAIAGAILSLATAGSMKFLSVFLEHIVVPSIKVSQAAQRVFKGIPKPDAPAIPARFSGAQAAAFGGLVEEVGKAGLDQALKPSSDFPSPSAKDYQLDTPYGVGNLRADFEKLINGSAKVVYDQFSLAQRWMNESTEFGEAWLADTDGNEAAAREKIRGYFESWTRVWARKWEFYGTRPQAFDRFRLAKQFERALWAAYLIQRIASTLNEGLVDTGQHNSRYYLGSRLSVAEEAVVNRLKYLNVVLAETTKGSLEQANRMIQDGAPLPTTEVWGSADFLMEAWNLRDWARRYLVGVRTETARDFFPPAVERQPARLGL